jgi:hypothetical protein
MLRVLFLLLFVMNFATFAQTQEKPKQDNLHKAYKVIEFGKVSVSEFRAIFDSFFVELQNNLTSQGYIINHGSDRAVAARERLIRSKINFRNFDPIRITFIRGKVSKEIKTEFWIVPEGAEPPKPE